MPNDAKLGLLAGVMGVIAVAIISTNRPAPAPVAAANPPLVPMVRSPESTALDQTDHASTPVPRTRQEPDGTPAGRESSVERIPE
jgi:hypothetical protein